MPRKGARKPIDPAKVLADVIPPAFPPPAPAERPRLKRLVENPSPRPSQEAVLDHYFAMVGGSAQFARELRQEYEAAEPGSQIRSRILDMLLRMMQRGDAANGSMDDMGLLTDADLNRLIDERERRLVTDAARAAEHDAVGTQKGQA